MKIELGKWKSEDYEEFFILSNDKEIWGNMSLELGAVFFLVQSMLTVIPEGKSNWYLPLALGLNCIALLLNAIQQKKKTIKAYRQ